MRFFALVLALFFGLFGSVAASSAAHAQPEPPEVRRLFEPSASEFRDELERSWIIIDLDASSTDFGKFGLYVFPSVYELAVGYFGATVPVAQPDGTFRVDEQVPVVIQRPTGEISPSGEDLPMTTESGSIQLSGTFDLNRHAASLGFQVDGRDVQLEANEPNLSGAPETAQAALNAYVGEDWGTLYGLYTDGLRVQVTQAEFEQRMRETTPQGPPVQVLSSEVVDVTLRTLTGIFHYGQLSRADLRQPSGRVTPVNVFVDVIWESGRWRLFHINIQRQTPPPSDSAPAA
jgi:hypothetical protein